MHAVLGSTIPGTGGGGSSDGGPKPGDLIADRYQIERFIGRGGMAEVFAGLNVRTGKRVALKWIRPALATTTEALARFRREAVAAGRIHHPNVVTVFDVVEHKAATWLVMELLEGETLSEILNRVERMNAEDAVLLLIPAMRGVAAAHAHGVVHRDLKPDNIFICRASDGQRREAKVLDFGVSKLSDEAGGEQVSITVTGNLVGTPTYMAPEQVRGNKVVDPRSDVYSLGVVLYQMLAGRPPFQGQVYSALMIEIATMDAPRLRTFRPDLSVDLEAIVHKAIARDLDRRYPDVTTFVRALENLIGLDSGQVVARMQALHSEPIDLHPELQPEAAAPVPPAMSADAVEGRYPHAGAGAPARAPDPAHRDLGGRGDPDRVRHQGDRDVARAARGRGGRSGRRPVRRPRASSGGRAPAPTGGDRAGGGAAQHPCARGDGGRGDGSGVSRNGDRSRTAISGRAC